MKGHELSRYEAANLEIDGDRVLTYSRIACPLDCAYCFANEIIAGNANLDGTHLSEEQFRLLEQLPPDIKTIRVGCDTEFLHDKDQALEALSRLVGAGKDISVITKFPLDDDYICELSAISDELESNGNKLMFSVSLTCTSSKRKWEPKAPRVARRIETVRKAYSAGINTAVVIRPLIPNIDPSELDEIVDATKDYVTGYYSGPLYLKELGEDTITAEEVAYLGCIVSEEVEDIHWMPMGNKFLKIESPQLMEYLRRKVEQSGKTLFQ